MDYVAISEYERSYKAGSIIVCEGAVGDEMFILNEGKLGVFREGKMIAQIDEAGVFFGEMSEILGGTRTATVQALSDCIVTVYTGGLDRIVREFPSISKKLIQTLAERLKDTTDRFYAFKLEVSEKKPERQRSG